MVVTFFSFSSGDYSSLEKHEDNVPGGGGMGLKVEEGQKLSQKQLQMLEEIAEEKGNSTNPLCREEQEMFRSLH